jgi:hypothetical protein
VASALAACAAAGTASAAVGSDFYGMNVQNVFDSSSSSWGAQLSALSNGGIQLGRVDARWSNVEPKAPSNGRHTYNWSFYDSVAQALAQHNIRWYPIIDYSTGWAGVVSGDSNSAVAPNHVGDFATYANVFAQRYGRGGSFWRAHPSLPQLPVTTYEIWNEENSTRFLHPQTNAPEQFADLYMAARAAIKPVDPQAEVVVGGLSLGTEGGGPDEISFLQRMVAHRPDMRGNTDAVGLHPYQLLVNDVYARIALFRQALDQLLGPQVPIEITEVGWSTTAVSDQERGTDLMTIAQTLPRTDCNITRLIPYAWTSPEQNRNNSDDWFGIYNRNATPKASASAFLGAVGSMRAAAAPTGTVSICHPAPAVVTGPELKLFYAVGRGHSSLRVITRCPAGCRLNIVILAPRAGAPARIAHRTLRFSRHRRSVRFRITHRLRKRHRVIILKIVATGSNGATTSVSHGVRIR